MHQTGAIQGLGHCVDWACHVINSRLDLLHLIKTIPSGEQTSMSQCETRPRREGDHTATLSLCGRGGGEGGTVQRLCCQPHRGPPDVPVIPLSVCVNRTPSGFAPSHSYLL